MNAREEEVLDLGEHVEEVDALPVRAFARTRELTVRPTLGPAAQAAAVAVTGSSDATNAPLAAPLGRMLYMIHLAVLLWWLLDKSPRQRATTALVALTQQLLPSASLALRVPPVKRFVIATDALVREALFEDPVAG